jgi:uncharacterized membrane protein
MGLTLLSVLLAMAQWFGPASLTALAADNQLPLGLRQTVLGAALAGAVGLFWAFAGRERASNSRVARAERLAWVTSPLLVLGLLPALLARGAWKEHEVSYLVLVGACTLLFERLLRVSMPHWPTAPPALRAALRSRLPPLVRRWLPLSAVALFILVYFAVISRYTLIAHERMTTMSSDLAEFDNLFFNALNGHPFRAPAIEGELANFSALKVHAEFGLYLLLPFYALSPGPEALLVLQTAIVAMTALPVYLLSARRLGRAAGVVFALAYLMMPAVQRPNFYDFHFTPLGMLLVAWVLYAANGYFTSPSPRPRQLWLLVVLFAMAMLAREDVAIGLCVLGLFIAASGANLRLGLKFAAAAGAYFAIVKFGVMPRFGTMWFDEIYDDLKAPGARGFGAVALTLVTNPVYVLGKLLTEAKLLYLLHMTVPLLALWTRRPTLWVAALPGFFSTLLVTNRPPMAESSFQYTYLWVPYVVAASVLVVAGLGSGLDLRQARVRRTAAVSALALAALLCGYQYGALLGADSIVGGFTERRFEVSAAERKRVAQLRKLLERIPAEASVAATEHEGPHVSTRLLMYSLKATLGQNPDYLLLGKVRSGGERDHVKQALDSGKYGVVAREGPFFLLERGASQKNNRALARKLGGL